MATSSLYEYDSSDSNLSQDGLETSFEGPDFFDECSRENCAQTAPKKNYNLIHKLHLRQIYGRVCANPRAKTEKLLTDVHSQCKFQLTKLIGENQDAFNHIFMGFTLCGRYLVSYTEKYEENTVTYIVPDVQYELYIWRFVPGRTLQHVAKYPLFKLLQGHYMLKDILFTQFPSDPYRLICYGSYCMTETAMAFITILTLPSPNNCKYCKLNSKFEQGWCLRHGFMLHFSFSLTQSYTQGAPAFDPHISLAYPDHFVINTGANIHILNVQSAEPMSKSFNFISPTLDKEINSDSKNIAQSSTTVTATLFADNASEASEISIDNFSTNSTIDAILEDFNEYDMDSAECNRPFHELNISCEPLNVTGKSYNNTLVQNNIVDVRVKRFQSSNIKNDNKPKVIDKKVAEKAYEFIEENEKCEKLSSFRKKRLADKKYEFREDNSENIVPFNSLRRERRFFKSDLNNLFLSPRSPGLRSPILSPNSRQFKSSPHYSKSPISPRDSSTRKFYVYSPSLDSDCSDSDSRLILRQSGFAAFDNRVLPSYQQQQYHSSTSGLLIVDSNNRRDESTRWIKKAVRRYSSVDYFENSSLVSGQSKDDFNMPIEIPLIVQNFADLQYDLVPECKADQITEETQLIITQRTFDCEQFVQRRAQKLCSDRQLQFLYCEDYDIKLLHICPIDGHIVCQAVIKISALRTANVAHTKPETFVAVAVFTWNVASDAFELIEPPEQYKLRSLKSDFSMDRVKKGPKNNSEIVVPPFNLPSISSYCRKVLVMDYDGSHKTKMSLRDYTNCYEILIESDLNGLRYFSD